MPWKGIVGLSFDPDSFDSYCHSVTWQAWRPSFIVLHNTGVPNLGQRPKGFSATHIKNLESFYRDKRKWSAGPHLFVDDRQIWVFTRLNVSGVHSPSWNKVSLGVEMLGDFDSDDFDSGRGAKVRDNTVAAVATLSAVLGLSPDSMKLHKEDTLTDHDCPGSGVKKDAFITAVETLIQKRHGGDH